MAPGMGSAYASLFVACLPVVAVLAGIRLYRPSDVRPWYLLAVGQAMVPIADVIWAVTGGHTIDSGQPSVGDLVYLAAYPLMATAFLLFIRARQPSYRLAAAVDALIVAVAGGLVVRELVIEQFIHDGSLPMLARLMLLAYPVGDVVLLSAAAYLMLSAKHGRIAVGILVASVTSLLAADVIYTSVPGSHAAGWPQPLWLASYLLIGLAALVPSMSELTVSRGLPAALTGSRRIVMLAVIALSIPAFAIIQVLFHDRLDLVAFGGASLAMLVLCFIRMYDLAAVQGRVERRHAAFLDHGSDAFAIIGLDGQRLYHSPAAERMLGYDYSTMAGQSILDISNPVDAPLLKAAFEQVGSAPGATASFEIPVRHADGTWRRIAVRGTNHTDEPLIHGVVWNYSDITERHAADQQVRSQAAMLAEVQHAVVSTDLEGRVTYWNGAAERMYGWSAEEVVGRPVMELNFDPDQQLIENFMGALPSHGRATSEFARRHRDGTPLTLLVTAAHIRDATGAVCGVISTSVDITDRKRLEQRLTTQAFTDELTGLPNRVLFMERLALELATGTGDAAHQPGLIFLDLDHFKLVNDGMGHGAGDGVLRVIGDRLSAGVGADATVARMGGDEFAILMPAADPRGVEEVAVHALSAIERPILLPEGEVRMRASIGSVQAGADAGTNADDLLRAADLAMYAAKAQGRHRHVAFHPAMHSAAVRRLQLKTDLDRAVEHGDLTLVFQPIINLEDRRVVGAEALARWTHPRHGYVSPAEFIPLAEESGLIAAIGRWALDESCRAVRAWREVAAGHGPALTVSVNASARELRDPEYPEMVAATLRRHGLKGDALVIEMTEGALMDDSEMTGMILGRLKMLGIQLAVDDFGTGWSSLGYLSRFSLDSLKIDRQFVSGPGCADRGWAIARSVVDLATSLRLRTVAEGIERPEELEAMELLGVTGGQGFLLAMPSTSAAMEALVSVVPSLTAVPPARRPRPRVVPAAV